MSRKIERNSVILGALEQKMRRKLLNEELGRKNVDEFKKAEKLPVIIVLDNVRSMHNVGSVFRTADSFIVESIYLCGITATPPHREIQKSALGSTESVAWHYTESACDAVKMLRSKGYTTIAVEQVEGSIMLRDLEVDTNRKYVLIFGHEINGVSQEVIDLCDLCVELPQYGTKHSFNISVTTGIVLWELANKLIGK